MMTPEERAENICFNWVASTWNSQDEWRASSDGKAIWKQEIADIAAAIRDAVKEEQ